MIRGAELLNNPVVEVVEREESVESVDAVRLGPFDFYFDPLLITEKENKQEGVWRNGLFSSQL